MWSSHYFIPMWYDKSKKLFGYCCREDLQFFQHIVFHVSHRMRFHVLCDIGFDLLNNNKQQTTYNNCGLKISSSRLESSIRDWNVDEQSRAMKWQKILRGRMDSIRGKSDNFEDKSFWELIRKTSVNSDTAMGLTMASADAMKTNRSGGEWSLVGLSKYASELNIRIR